MCLIAIAGKGTNKYSDLFLDSLRMSAKTNDDGVGYAFKRAKQIVDTGRPVIYFGKGLFKIDDVIELLKKENLLPEDELIVHLRKISAGVRSSENCHPFICTLNDEWINDVGPSYTVSAAVFHNGHFPDFKDINNRKSDTHLFVEKFLKQPSIMKMLKDDQEAFEDTFAPILKSNRLAILNPQFNKIVTIGEFLEDEGYLFSNTSYKDKTIINRGGININTNSRIRNQESLDFSGLNGMEKHMQDPNNKLLVTNINWEKVILIATEESKSLNISLKDRFAIHTFSWENPYQCIYKLNKPTQLIWVTTEQLYSDFDAYKKMSAVPIFDNFYSMKSWLKPVTNTVIRKLNKILEKNRYRPDESQVEVNFKNKARTYRIGAIKMFIADYESDKNDDLLSPVIILPENLHRDEPNPFIDTISVGSEFRLLSEDEVAWRKEQEELGFKPEDIDFVNKIIKKEEKKEKNSKNLTDKEIAEDILKKDKLADEFFEKHGM